MSWTDYKTVGYNISTHRQSEWISRYGLSRGQEPGASHTAPAGAQLLPAQTIHQREIWISVLFKTLWTQSSLQWKSSLGSTNSTLHLKSPPVVLSMNKEGRGGRFAPQHWEKKSWCRPGVCVPSLPPPVSQVDLDTLITSIQTVPLGSSSCLFCLRCWKVTDKVLGKRSWFDRSGAFSVIVLHKRETRREGGAVWGQTHGQTHGQLSSSQLFAVCERCPSLWDTQVETGLEHLLCF